MSGDLRATDAWRRLQTYIIRAGDARLGPTWQEAMEALDALDPALIPKDGVWVTEETLAAALHEATLHNERGGVDNDLAKTACVQMGHPTRRERKAAAILRHLREGT